MITHIKEYLAFITTAVASILLPYHSVVFSSLWPHGLQHTRLPCPVPSPRVCSNLCPLNWTSFNHLIRCHLLLLPPSIFPSIRVSSNEYTLCIRWPKQWSFSFSISPSNEYSGLISFGSSWFDLLDAQGTLTSLLQHHSVKAPVFQPSTWFMVQLSHQYMPTGKTVVLTRWTFVCKVMSLLFNMLSRLVIAFLPRSKHLLISWLQSPFAVILEPPKKVCHCCHFFPTYSLWSDGTGCHDLSVLNVEF